MLQFLHWLVTIKSVLYMHVQQDGLHSITGNKVIAAFGRCSSCKIDCM